MKPDQPSNMKLTKIMHERDGGNCKICGENVDLFDWELEHNKALSKGGSLTAAIIYTGLSYSECYG